MPWSHCDVDEILDSDPCPGCGSTKAEWTIEIGQTREFVVAAPKAKRKREGWIEVELLDAAGVAVAEAPYRVALPNGRVKKGTLDASGVVRLEELPEGACQVSFPEHLPEKQEAASGQRHTFRLSGGGLLLRTTLTTSRGEPVDHAPFAVIGADGQRVAEGVTDAEGAVSVEVPDAGDYAIELLEDEDDAAPDWRATEGEEPAESDGEWSGAPQEVPADWPQRQATSCGAYALAHAFRLAARTLDTDADGQVEPGEWEHVHSSALPLWSEIKFGSPPPGVDPALAHIHGILASHEYSSPARIAHRARQEGRLDGFFFAGGEQGLADWASRKDEAGEGSDPPEPRTASGMPMPALLQILVNEAEAVDVSATDGDGLDAIRGAHKYAIAPCDARTYLHYVLFRENEDGALEVYDSQSDAYTWQPVDPPPKRGEAFATPGSAGTLTYLGITVVVSGDAP